MPTARSCPQCGAELTETANGLCPACLMKQGLASLPASAATIVSHPVEDQTIDLAPGSKVRYFGEYELLEEVARGGMGVIYRARQGSLNRIVALKMILSGQLASAVEVKRFYAEAKAAASLQHPNIVAIHEVGEHGGRHYFSMDYVEGKNLTDLAGGQPLPAPRAARYVQLIAEAVHFAHRRGTLHRDLKPQNVLIDAHDQPRITDFGLAKTLDDEIGLTLSGEVMGSPNYMAPEQAAGRHEQVGPHTDVYALGAILYELLVGRPPFSAPTAMATMQKVLEAEPAAPRSLNPGVPADVETICLKCLEKSPARRYASAQELAEDLARFLRGEPIQARPPGVLGRLDRWARLRPALAFRLLALAVFYLFHLVLLGLGTADEGGFFHRFVTVLVVVWAAGAVVVQRWAMRSPRKALPIYCGAAAEVVLLTLLLWQGYGPRSALLVAYPLLIAGTALRQRIGLLWLVTGLSAAGYLGLVIEAALRRPQFAVELKDWVIFNLSLFVLGFVQQLLLRRIKAASLSER